MSKELLKEVIESLVDEKTVEQIIGDRVNYLLEINFEREMRNKAKELANVIAKEKVEKIIDEYLSKEVVVNDG